MLSIRCSRTLTSLETSTVGAGEFTTTVYRNCDTVAEASHRCYCIGTMLH